MRRRCPPTPFPSTLVAAVPEAYLPARHMSVGARGALGPREGSTRTHLTRT